MLRIERPLPQGVLNAEATFFPLCTGSFKHSLVGATLHTPGLLSLLSNLATTCDVPDADQVSDVDLEEGGR